MDKSLKRGMFNKFESRKICVAGYQCDTSDFDFCIAEHNELSVVKICSDKGRDDCQQKGTEASFGTTVITDFDFTIACCVFSSNIRELKNHDDGFVDDGRKRVTVYCASATSKFRRRGVVDDAKLITSSCNPQASAGINPLF